MDLFSGCRSFLRYKRCLKSKDGMENASCWPQDDKFKFLDTIFLTYCTKAVLGALATHTECLEEMIDDWELFACRADTLAAHKGDVAYCTAIKDVHDFIKCGKTVLKRRCNVEIADYLEMVKGRLADRLITLNCGLW